MECKPEDKEAFITSFTEFLFFHNDIHKTEKLLVYRKGQICFEVDDGGFFLVRG